MLELDTILVAHDLTDASFAAFSEACVLAQTFGAKLLLVHAIPEAPESSQDYELVAGKVRELFADLQSSPEAQDVAFVEPTVGAADPARLVLATAIEQGVDLILLGSGEKSTLDRILLGSTAETVVREATKPVWLTRPGRQHAAVKRMVCALDASEPAQAALKTAAFLARTFVADLTLVSVADPGEAAAQAKVLATARDAIDLHGIDVTESVREGDVVSELVAAVGAPPADLLILGSAGRRGISRWLHKNTAEKVIRMAPCSILTISARSA